MPIPNNAYVELNLDLISEGKLRAEIDRQLRQAYVELMDREQVTGERTAAATVGVKITLARSGDADQYWKVGHSVTRSIPPIVKTSLCRGANNRLICQPTGASEDSPDQMILFDGDGQPAGTLDPVTGEVDTAAPAVAGTVGA